jgi:hypothetical protein
LSVVVTDHVAPSSVAISSLRWSPEEPLTLEPRGVSTFRVAKDSGVHG